ncbi:MAG: N(4)-(beta-N-acetylglucosaminyl)-L-asparaginase [Candidatus Aminicenantes bacterium]
MAKRISRRSFFNQSVGLGAGTLLFNRLSAFQTAPSGTTPMMIVAHTNETGKKASETGWKILADGGSALDAVEKAANIIELDGEGMGVGYGGLPNEDGIVQLDASIMDGKTYNAGSVACLENIKTPCSVARVVMEKTDHVMLVGKDALEFARICGFEEHDLLTEKARKVWLYWKEHRSEHDDWGPPEHLKKVKKEGGDSAEDDNEDFARLQGTTNVLAIDKNGDVAGVTTTSGLSFKIPGRTGDSPIIGAGLYVDNEVGAAAATGRGEDVIKSCSSFYMVMRMKEGRTPQQACDDAVRLIASKYKAIKSDFLPGETFRAINKKGEYGCARMVSDSKATMSVINSSGYRIHEGSLHFYRERRRR